jgi:hypothetical protein
MGMIVAFVSQKGGVGKSTLARALAQESTAGGLSAKVADHENSLVKGAFTHASCGNYSDW